MQNRIKLFSDYRKSIEKINDIEVLNEYKFKHLEIVEKKEIIDKKVTYLNEYEKNKVMFKKYFYKKRLYYYLLITLISLILLSLIILLGFKIF